MALPAHSPFDLTGRVALVTGGNSGIGLGMADALAAHGADVAIWGTNADKNATARQQLGRHRRQVVDLVVDVGEQEQVEAGFAATVAALGRVDACFANAGVAPRAPSFAAMTAEEWHRVLRVNLDGCFYTCQAAVRHWVDRAPERREGAAASLVVTTSTAVIHGQPRGQHYGAAKGGIIAMMKAIAVENARHGVRANAILPGWIDTDMAGGTLATDAFRAKVLPRVPLRRWGTGDDFGGIAVYLASDASRYHTGDTFVIDGGYTIF